MDSNYILDFSKIPLLTSPIITTTNDVILSGHGALASMGQTSVPQGMELWVLPPLGATIADSLGQAMESMTKISKLGIYSGTTKQLSSVLPVVYKPGTSAPNYTLSSPSGIVLKPNGPHLLGVTTNTKLSDLWARVTPFVKPGKVTRVFWAACTAVKDAQNQTVYFQ